MTTIQEIQKAFLEEIKYVDDLAQIVLKGHLVMEDLMNQALESFALHGNLVEKANLRFYQKLILCKSISTSDHNNTMWNLIEAINSLRNQLSHSLDPEKRTSKIDNVRKIYLSEFKNLPKDIEGIPEESAICILAIHGCLGYLHSFLSEIKRLETIIKNIDTIMNKGKLGKS